YNLLWGDLVQIPLPGGSSLGLSLLVMILVPAGVYFTVRSLREALFCFLYPVALFRNTDIRQPYLAAEYRRFRCRV
ncbi:hypothetical protein H6B10_16775, partial [Gemmiger formicilis]|nr:hypothetical protein [Gemmiger formicilis]